MRHLILCPEFPPAPIPPGGIGTYVSHIARMMAQAGETVHIVAPRWEGAPKKVEEFYGGRLIIHRVACDEPISRRSNPAVAMREIQGLLRTDFSRQCFSWQAGLLAEILVEETGIDLIEAQDYDAPLYFFQLRRALGLGPQRRPPCIIHLHSPTEFIVRHNEWDLGQPDFLTAKRQEDYCIDAADALLCPSHFLARASEARYGMEARSITVIRLPIGDTPGIDRADAVWRDGTICYLGRLQPGKGVIEWVEAAAAVAEEYPSARFEFIGADLPYTLTLSVQQLVEKRIPDHLKARFHFRGSRQRSEINNFLKQARMVVVPSRWENFPYTCIEAMCSGLPVIVSPSGGMAEMIRDGETGWVADNARSDGLEAALRRALATPPHQLAEMGWQASQDIRRMCHNGNILEEHLQFKRKLADQGSSHSLRLPANLPWAGGRLDRPPKRREPRQTEASGIAVVVRCDSTADNLDRCLDSLTNQTCAPILVVVVRGREEAAGKRAVPPPDQDPKIRICAVPGGSAAALKNAGIRGVFSSGITPLAMVFIDGADELDSRFVETCENTFRNCPEVGLVSSWMESDGEKRGFSAPPCPSFPYQLLDDDTVPATAIRTEALAEAGLFRPEMDFGMEHWDAVNAVMAAGWVAVTYPGLLCRRQTGGEESMPGRIPSVESRMRQAMLVRFHREVERDCTEIVYLLEAKINRFRLSIEGGHSQSPVEAEYTILRPRDLLRLSRRQQLALIRKALRHPATPARFLLWHARGAMGRLWSSVRGDRGGGSS